MFRNLAIKGGGVRGIAFVGALRELDSLHLLQNITRVAGTSAGAMVAAMVSAQYTVDEIEQLMHSLNFKKFEDEFNPLRIATHYGLYGGDYILDFVKQFLEQSPNKLNADSTFLDLRNSGCRDLFVFAADLSTFSITEFSADATPDVKVAEAVRASMSIPVFFKAWQFADGRPTNHLYVDGGLVFNYPITFFDTPRFNAGNNTANEETLGLYLRTKGVVEKRELVFNQVMHFARHLFETMLNSQDVDFEEDLSQIKRSIVIDDLGILSTDFHITSDDMSKLVESGTHGTKLFFEKRASAESAPSL